MIKIIIDSTCEFPQDLIEKYDIKMLSLMVNIGEKAYRDKVEISTSEVYQKITEGVDIKTSLPSSQDIYDLFASYAKQGNDFIYISIASKLSGTYSLAHQILNEVKEEYPNLKAGIVDSQTSGLGIGIMIFDIIDRIEKNQSFEEVFAFAQDLTNHVKAYVMVNDLSQLVKGGCISKTKGVLASTLSIRPILQVKDGEVKAIVQVRGTKKAIKKLVELVDDYSFDKNQTIAINYSSNQNLAEDLISELKNIGFHNFVYEPIGSVLSSHFGLDAVGAFLIDTPTK